MIRLVADSDNVAGLPGRASLLPNLLVAVATYSAAQVAEAATRFPGLPVLQINVGQADETPPLPLALRVKVEDVESGALTPAQAAELVGSNPDLPFLVYHDLSEAAAVYGAVGPNGWRAPAEWPRPGWYDWIADPTGQLHCPASAIMCQCIWAGPYDLSVVNPAAPSTFPTLPAAAPPTAPPKEIPDMIYAVASEASSDGNIGKGTQWVISGTRVPVGDAAGISAAFGYLPHPLTGDQIALFPVA